MLGADLPQIEDHGGRPRAGFRSDTAIAMPFLTSFAVKRREFRLTSGVADTPPTMPRGVEETTETATLPRLPVATKLFISSRRLIDEIRGVEGDLALRAGPVGSNWSQGAADSIAGQHNMTGTHNMNNPAPYAAPADRHPRRILFPSP